MCYNKIMKINIKSYKKIKDNCYKLELSDGNTLTLYDEVILKYNLLLKRTIDSKLLDELLVANNESLCYNKALKYLSIKQRNKKEMEDYLKRSGFSKEVIVKALKRLEEQNYLNEELYIKSFINDQFNLTSNGPEKIKQKLLDLKLNEKIITKYLQEITKDEWLNKLNRLIDKKLVIYKKESLNKTKEKILLNCLNSGFNKEDILNILNTKEITSDFNTLKKELSKLYRKLKEKYKGSTLEYQLKGRLLSKGYTYEEIEEALQDLSI